MAKRLAKDGLQISYGSGIEGMRKGSDHIRFPEQFSTAVYDAVYLIPICLITVLWSRPYINPDFSVAVAGAIAMFTAGILILFINLNVKGRMISGAVLIAVLAASIAVCPTEVLKAFISENSSAFLLLSEAAGSFIIGRLLCGFRVSRTILSLGLLVALLVSMFMGTEPGKLVVSLAVVVIISSVIEEIEHRWEKAESLAESAQFTEQFGKTASDYRQYLVFLIPFLTLLFILMLFFPVSDKPYGWGFVKVIYDVATQELGRLWDRLPFGNSTGYGDAFAGFSDASSLEGDIRDSDKRYMEVKCSRESSPCVYLAGRTFDTFTGRSWEKSYKDDGRDVLFDSLETGYYLSQYFGNSYYDYFKRTSIDIRFLDIKSRHIFAPGKFMSVSSNGKSIPFSEEGGDLLFEEKKGYNNSYKVLYYRLNRDNPDFLEFLDSDGGRKSFLRQMSHNSEGINASINTEASRKLDSTEQSSQPDGSDHKLWEEMLGRLGFTGTEGFSYEDYLSYSERVQAAYLKETPVSTKLRSYLDDLLKGAEGDTDKLERIEGLLASMKYNKSPGEMPKEVDSPEEFLDYFIFEKREGFCVYYATAFVLLARAEGIPARYVQGFRIPSNQGNTTIVTGNNSHAWPECYIDGTGWIPYEPTPGFKVADSFKTAKNTRPVESTKPDLPEKVKEEQYVEMEEDAQDEGVKFEWKYIVFPMAAGAAAVLILIALQILFGSLRYKRSDNEKKLRMMFQKNMFILKLLSYKISEGETLGEFACRIRGFKSSVLPYEYEMEESLAFISVYEAHLYRGDPAGEREVALFEKNNRELAMMAKSSGLKNRFLVWTQVW